MFNQAAIDRIEVKLQHHEMEIKELTENAIKSSKDLEQISKTIDNIERSSLRIQETLDKVSLKYTKYVVIGGICLTIFLSAVHFLATNLLGILV